jgi:hypothetical protein
MSNLVMLHSTHARVIGDKPKHFQAKWLVDTALTTEKKWSSLHEILNTAKAAFELSVL